MTTRKVNVRLSHIYREIDETVKCLVYDYNSVCQTGDSQMYCI